MRVLFLANSSWYLKNFRSSTLNRFSAFSETWCLHPFEEHAEDLTPHGVKQRSFHMDPAGVGYWGEIRGLFSLFFNMAKARPDVLFSFNPKTNLYSLMACYFLRIRCFPNVSGVGVASQLSGLKGYLYEKFCAFFYSKAAGVFFQNKNDRDDFLTRGWVSEKKAFLVPGSGVNLGAYTPSYGVDREKVRFLLATRLIEQKGVVDFCEVAKRIRSHREDCEFFLAGVPDSSSRAISNARIKEYVDIGAINFLGHVKDMPSLLETVDCSVLPSYYPEGTPRSLIEAAAAGKVIITTDTPGCRDLVDGNGLIVAPRSIEELASAVEKVANMEPSARAELMQRSRQLAESNYDENIVINKYISVL